MARVITVTRDQLIREIIDLVAEHGRPEKLIRKQWRGDWKKSHIIDKINRDLFLLGAKPYEDCCERCAAGPGDEGDS